MTTRDRTSYHPDEYTRWHDPDPTPRINRVTQETARILTHLDPTGPRSGTDDTPERVAKMWVNELTIGYHENVPALFKTFKSDSKDLVIIKDIPLVSTCEHHLVPFIGHAHVGYLPEGAVVGLSKIKRVVDAYARRLQIQERLTSEIADAMDENLSPRGVMVVLEAEHLCMTIRGVQAPGTRTITSAVRGAFNENKEGEKEEFLRLLRR